MNPFEFDDTLTKRLLKLRQTLNRSAQCMNHNSLALARMYRDSRKSQLRLEAATNRLANCLRAHNL